MALIKAFHVFASSESEATSECLKLFPFKALRTCYEDPRISNRVSYSLLNIGHKTLYVALALSRMKYQGELMLDFNS